MTYSRNIERLRSRSRQNTSDQIQDNTWAANNEAALAASEAKSVANSLSSFSKSLHDWKIKDIGEKQEQGKLDARKQKREDALRLIELQGQVTELEKQTQLTKEQDTQYQYLKQEMLKVSGTNVYPEAERIAHLSPWAQVGYAQEKLRSFNETFDDKLAHEMANSEKAIQIGGMSFTPKQMRENNIQALPFKQASIEILSEDIREAAGVNNFSPELLKMAKTEEAVQKSKDSQLGKIRDRYNIDSSMQTRGRALTEWSNSDKTGDDLHRLILINSNTVDKNGSLLGNAGGLTTTFDAIAKEGIALGKPELADHYAAMPLPPQLARKLGVKQGTTFGQQWPGRFAALKKDIRAGYTKATKAELDYQQAAGDGLEAEFIAAARKGDLTTQQVNDYKRQFGELGLTVPSGVTKYETASMRDEREDKQTIKALMASQKGHITNDQLDTFHPLAALEFREKADKFEKAAIKDHDSEVKIKASLDRAFTNMGIKANEKSPAYVEALSNAKADYATKYWRYVNMGYSSAEASHYALHANQVVNKETREVIPDSMGVIFEIKHNQESSKYVVTGQSIEKLIKPGTLRVARIASGKREIRDDPSIIHTDVIGGAYGQRQLDSIKANLDKYGGERGIWKNKGARQYYEGLARGRDGNWMGLVDAQLKATGHPGLWPNERPPEQDLYKGRNVNGEKVEDPNGLLPIAKSIERASKYPNYLSYQYVTNLAKDARDYQTSSYSWWENQNMLSPWLRYN